MDIHKIDFILNQIAECTPNEIKTISQRLKHLAEEKLNTQQKESKLTQSKEWRGLTLLVHGRQYFHEEGKPSSYEYVLIDEESGKKKWKTSDKMQNETSNRAIIHGIMDAIQSLNRGQKFQIQIFSKGSWGFSKMKKRSKGVNGDLLTKLHDLIEESGHLVEAEHSNEIAHQYFQ